MEPEDITPNDDDQDGMHPMVKVGRLNLIILLVYAGVIIVISFLSAPEEAFAAWLLWTGLAMLVQGGINLAAAIVLFIMRKAGMGAGALVSGFVLLIIGFSSCVAAFSTFSLH